MLRQVPESILSVKVGNKTITGSPSARNIGVVMDSILSMEHQVANVCRACYMGIRDIGKIRHYLAEDTTKHLVIALVISKLDSQQCPII